MLQSIWKVSKINLTQRLSSGLELLIKKLLIIPIQKSKQSTKPKLKSLQNSKSTTNPAQILKLHNIILQYQKPSKTQNTPEPSKTQNPIKPNPPNRQNLIPQANPVQPPTQASKANLPSPPTSISNLQSPNPNPENNQIFI